MINGSEYIHSPGRNGAQVEIAILKRESIPLLSPRQIYLENPIGFKRIAFPAGRWQKFI